MRLVIPLMFLIGCSTPLGKLPVDSGKDTAAEETGATAGDECTGGGVYDCSLDCWVSDALAYLGDGTCDTGQRGPNFDCAETDFDGGDCDTSDDDGGTTDDGSGGTDAGTTDAGTTDAGTTDAGTTDAGTTDAGTTDAGTTDAGATSGAGTGGEIGSGTGGEIGGGTGVDTGWGTGGSTGGGSGEPGEPCDAGWSPGVYDCSGSCVDAEYATEYSDDGFSYGYLGDGSCDDGGWSYDFDCETFDFDGGDCGACYDEGGSPSAAGDGYCDSYNNNEACDYDGGDCCATTCEDDSFTCGPFDCRDPDAPPLPEPAPGALCVDSSWGSSSVGVYDCNEECKTSGWGSAVEDYLGDGTCHTDGDSYGHYNCEAFDWDGGDCCESSCEGSSWECSDFDCADPDQITEACTTSSGEEGLYACDFDCLPVTVLDDHWGDGLCDDLGIRDLDCEAFDYDRGDCADTVWEEVDTDSDTEWTEITPFPESPVSSDE